MSEHIRFSEEEVARVVGYARVRGDRRPEPPRGRKAKAPRGLALRPRLQPTAPRAVFA